MSEEQNSRTARRKSQQRKRTTTKTNDKPKGKKIVKRIFLSILFLGLFLFLGGAGLFAYYAATAPKLDEALLRDPLSSDLLDVNGEVFYQSGVEKREFVPYDEIPETVKNAILATEDVRFFKHHGMDFYRLGGAVLANFRSGFGSQGASTLTQQVIKNSFFTEEKTLKRKAQEAWLAFQLERKYDKEEIFEMYFNKILMSGSTYGFGTASQHFYGKNLDQLELHEVAMLAGLPQSPNGYNPFKNPERAEKRRNIVLSLMNQHSKITESEMTAAKSIPVTQSLLAEDERKKQDNTKYAAFVDLVRDELDAEGLLDLLSEGVTIQTTLDPNAQTAVEDALASDIFPNEEIQSALSVVNTTTGEIAAIGGGRNYQTGYLNFATDEKRQPGSVIKPILDYAPAIEYLNWSTGQTVRDDKYFYKGTKKEVKNIDLRHQGAITTREALSRSRNIPAVKTYVEVGPDRANKFADGIGIHLTNENHANAIGGTDDEFSTLEIAGAYSAFGNNGVYIKPHSIKKIIFRDGKTVRNVTPKPVIAMKDSTAFMVTDMLRDVMKSGGTGAKANVSGLNIAGKTGTTNKAIDSWFTGYTTDYTISVWGGYQKRNSMEGKQEQRDIPQRIFKRVMTDISKGKNTARFKQPSSVVEGTIQYGSEPLALASPSTPQNLRRTELFVRGTIPEKVAKEEPEIALEAPTNLTAAYDEITQSVALNWSHNAPDPEILEGEVLFKISASADSGETVQMTTTADHSVVLTGVEPNKTYTFTVVATLGELESAPASVTLLVQEDEIPEEEPEIPEETPEEEFPPTTVDPPGQVPPPVNNGNGNNGGNNENEGNQQPSQPDNEDNTSPPPTDENINQNGSADNPE